MILKVTPASFLSGTVELPASKSYSIRAFMIAACGGTSTIIHPSDCDDSKVAMATAQALGARIIRKKDNSFLVAVKTSEPQPDRVHVGESGTVLRFVLPLLSLNDQKVLVTGEGTLRGRPNRFLLQALRDQGVNVQGTGPQEGIPIRITGGRLSGGNIRIPGTLSSQFISALLIACPRAPKDTRLTLTGKEIVSSDYMTMTLQVLKTAGILIHRRGERTFLIPGNQKYKGLKRFCVPSDYGLASFLMAAAILTNSDVHLMGYFNDDFIQADGQILTLLKKMGARFQISKRAININGPFLLKGGNFSLKNCPDLVPVMAVLAMFAKGRTRLYGIGHARVKESDRISDLRMELEKVGAKIHEKKDELIIQPQPQYKLNCLLDPHHDHRLAMAFAVLGVKLGLRVKDIVCTSKSYPGFVRDFKSLGCEIAQS